MALVQKRIHEQLDQANLFDERDHIQVFDDSGLVGGKDMREGHAGKSLFHFASFTGEERTNERANVVFVVEFKFLSLLGHLDEVVDVILG